MIQNFIIPAAVQYQNKLIKNITGLTDVLGNKAGKEASKSQVEIVLGISEGEENQEFIKYAKKHKVKYN